ncbi:MAG: valine--tRNA ligase [Paracoccaceae bacterium]
MEKTFKHSEVERRLIKKWEETNSFCAGVHSKKSANAPFSIVIPPPNVTGNLHMGHAFNNTIQDILVRWHRMRGYETLWQPGQDHAGIATQMVVERDLAKNENVSREEIGREKFLEKIWEWKAHSGGMIIKQLKRLGASCDWDRNRFTMDKDFQNSVLTAFVKMYEMGYIYKGERLVNWDPHFKTAISDLEVENIEVDGYFWHIKYPLKNKENYDYQELDEDGKLSFKDNRNYISIATTRPETMLGDGAIAVHPDDERYKNIIGKEVIIPIANRAIPIIADQYPDPNFGSGAVKITGAHDFNDYMVAKKHNLDFFKLMDESACMCHEDFIPKKYRGLERYKARETLLKELEQNGFLLKTEKKKIIQPFGDRSKVVVEPFLTKQWFVDTKKIVQPAIDAVKDGRTKIYPKRDIKTYLNWLENIEPWCISRQLWWGHQIPVWYDEDGNYFCATSEDKAKEISGKKKLSRDSDVLDTWFSSGIWPIGTLGWPSKTNELEKYYPTSVLVTGFDILFFWVARMMMMQLALINNVPFKKVYVHALVRDEKGKKMSKSLGNVLDPLELIDKYGADAVRFTLSSMAAMGRDLKLSTERIIGYRNFGTKIWNAARYAKLNNCESSENFNPGSVKHSINKWIIFQTINLKKEVDSAIESFRFNDAAYHLYSHIWSKFCDWYIEFSKPLFSGDDVKLKIETQFTFAWVLDQCLILLHPFMPFITEEIWQQNKNRKNLIVHETWPYFPNVFYSDDESQKEINWIIDLIQEIRSVRSEINIPASLKIHLKIVSLNEQFVKCIDNNEVFIEKLARVESIKHENSIQSGSINISIPGIECFIPLENLIDISKEKSRLEKNYQKLKSEQYMLNNKLKNKSFLEKAPKDVVEKIKKRSSILVEEINTKLKAIERLN